MKTSFISLFVVALVALVGCSANSTQTPKATATAAKEQPAEPVKTVVNKPIISEADESFSLSVPFESVALTQGEEQSVLIGINRGVNFLEDVAIDVSGLPEGVTLATADPVIKLGSTDATLRFEAAGDAALGDFTVKLTGHTSSSGADFTKELKMTVDQK
jgi:uncharacterized membrane protein